jgi:hypothetical protein
MRCVIKQPLFEEQLQNIEADAKRADDLIIGIEFTLSRNPSVGVQLPGHSDVWTISSVDNAVDLCPLLVYYTFNSQKVFLLEIHKR